MEWIKDEFVFSDDIAKVDVKRVYELLSATYWGVRRPLEVVEAITRTSLCFTLLLDNRQAGFGRCVTDATTFAWIADIIIEPEYRGRGIGRWMMDCIMAHPQIAPCQKVLQTRDAHTYYEKYGFSTNPALMSTQVDGL